MQKSTVTLSLIGSNACKYWCFGVLLKLSLVTVTKLSPPVTKNNCHYHTC
jgi:hypothetical protein